jgi:hypothetical protein
LHYYWHRKWNWNIIENKAWMVIKQHSWTEITEIPKIANRTLLQK